MPLFVRKMDSDASVASSGIPVTVTVEVSKPATRDWIVAPAPKVTMEPAINIVKVCAASSRVACTRRVSFTMLFASFVPVLGGSRMRPALMSGSGLFEEGLPRATPDILANLLLLDGLHLDD